MWIISSKDNFLIFHQRIISVTYWKTHSIQTEDRSFEWQINFCFRVTFRIPGQPCSALWKISSSHTTQNWQKLELGQNCRWHFGVFNKKNISIYKNKLLQECFERILFSKGCTRNSLIIDSLIHQLRDGLPKKYLKHPHP